MPTFPITGSEQRTAPRLKVPAMYTLLRAGPAGSGRYEWSGHIYDISMSGIRFELDQPLEPGTKIEVRGMLPGGAYTSFRATGTVVRLHSDPEETGPATMGLAFEHFNSPMDHERLSNYLTLRGKTWATNRAA